MASKKGNRIVIKLKSTESGHQYTTQKNRKNDPSRLELRRYASHLAPSRAVS